jgi:hypothetical protein
MGWGRFDSLRRQVTGATIQLRLTSQHRSASLRISILCAYLYLAYSASTQSVFLLNRSISSVS